MKDCEAVREPLMSIIETLFSDLVEGRVTVDEYAVGYTRAKLFSAFNSVDEHPRQWANFTTTTFFRDDVMCILTSLKNRQLGEYCRFLSRIALKRLCDAGYEAVFYDDGVRAMVQVGREYFDLFDLWNTYVTGHQAPPIASDHAIKFEM